MAKTMVGIRAETSEIEAWKRDAASQGKTLSSFARDLLNNPKRALNLVEKYSNMAIINAFNDPEFVEKYWKPYREAIQRRVSGPR